MTPRNKLTPKQWAALAEARRAGATIKQLQERFCVSYAVASEVARNNDALPAQGAAKCIHPHIAKWMIRNQVSRKEFALRAGVSLKVLCSFLSGATKTPTGKNLRAIERVTRLSISEIMKTEEKQDHAE